MTTLSVCEHLIPVNKNQRPSNEMSQNDYRDIYIMRLENACQRHFYDRKTSLFLPPILILEGCAIANAALFPQNKKISMLAAACGLLISAISYRSFARLEKSNLSCTEQKTCTTCEKLIPMIKKENSSKRISNLFTLSQSVIVNLAILDSQTINVNSKFVDNKRVLFLFSGFCVIVVLLSAFSTLINSVSKNTAQNIQSAINELVEVKFLKKEGST